MGEPPPSASQPLTPLESSVLLVMILLQLVETRDGKSEAPGQASNAEGRKDVVIRPKSLKMQQFMLLTSKLLSKE